MEHTIGYGTCAQLKRTQRAYFVESRTMKDENVVDNFDIDDFMCVQRQKNKKKNGKKYDVDK